jgi:hypothetical protein
MDPKVTALTEANGPPHASMVDLTRYEILQETEVKDINGSPVPLLTHTFCLAL